MSELVVQANSLAGLSPEFSAADAAGDTFRNNGRTLLHVQNGGAGAVTVTIESRKQCDQGYDHNVVANVPAGETVILGPFRPERFNDAAGLVSVAYSDEASVTVAAISQ